MALFSKFKDMYRIQKQAKQARSGLKNIHIESEADSLVKVTVTGEQEVVSLEISDDAVKQLQGGSLRKTSLEEACKKALNKALKKSQEIAAEKTKGLWKEMGM